MQWAAKASVVVCSRLLEEAATLLAAVHAVEFMIWLAWCNGTHTALKTDPAHPPHIERTTGTHGAGMVAGLGGGQNAVSAAGPWIDL